MKREPWPRLLAVIVVAGGLALAGTAMGQSPKLDYQIELTTASKGFDGKTCWVHARAGIIPAGVPGNAGKVPAAVMTLQKLLLTGSDVFYPLNTMISRDLGRPGANRNWSPSSSDSRKARRSR